MKHILNHGTFLKTNKRNICAINMSRKNFNLISCSERFLLKLNPNRGIFDSYIAKWALFVNLSDIGYIQV